MRKIEWQISTNLIVALIFYWLAFTGIMLEYFVPHGNAKNKEFLQISRHTWNDIHLILGLSFIALIIVHLALHWRWIYELIFKKEIIQQKWQDTFLIIVGILSLLAPVALIIIMN